MTPAADWLGKTTTVFTEDGPTTGGWSSCRPFTCE